MKIKAMKNAANGLPKAWAPEEWQHHYDNLAAYQALQDMVRKPFPAALKKEPEHCTGMQRHMQHPLLASPKNKLAALDSGFTGQQPAWDYYLKALTCFFQTHGHTYLPAEDPAYEALRDWLLRQIQGQQYLPEEQREQLDALGVDWNMASGKGLRWHQMFLKLKAFYQIYGHSRVPQKWPLDSELANWVSVQRRVYGQQKMPAWRVRLLGQLDFLWHIQARFDAQWDRFYRQLAAFRQQHGHCRVPGTYIQLVSWMERQRIACKNNLLPEHRKKQLSGINFIWAFDDIKETQWQEKFRQLQAYKDRHGHCLVPVRYIENRTLGHWVATQRRLEAEQKLPAEKQRQLDGLGFAWSRQTLPQLHRRYNWQWQAHFEKLRAYQLAHGTCQVSLKIDPELQRWTRWQRKLFQEGRLQPHRRQQLDAIHFPWNIQESYWLKMYQALADFQRRLGHTRVPNPKTNNKLAAWVCRQKKNKAQLTAWQVELLEALGFDWHLPERVVVPWEHMYERLVAYKQAFGHTRVPVAWHQDPKLGRWVSRMRQEKDCLSPAQTELLNALAFDWSKRLAREVNS